MEIAKITTIDQLKSALNTELNKTANSFVRIGYLLKLARDEQILKGSGYTDVNDFAQKEFGIDKTQVSRFIRINDRFSIGGYSENLKIEYESYGSAKLSLMLTLPDELNEELSPDFSKSDIQAIKEEYEAEQKISDIEVMCEEKDDEAPDEFIELIIKQLNDEHPEPAKILKETIELAHKMGIEPGVQDVKEDTYCPTGSAAYNIRISGQGRFMISMKEDGITILNMRSMEKSPLTWEEFTKAVLNDVKDRTFEDKPEEKKKPEKAKVQKSAASVAKNENKKPESVKKNEPSENFDHDKNMEEIKEEPIERVEGEIVESDSTEEKQVKTHGLKTLPQYFRYSFEGVKRFELRKDDRGFDIGDYVELKEWDGYEYTGRVRKEKIKYILRDCQEFGLQTGYCILGF